MLQKYILDPSNVANNQSIELERGLSYDEVPIRIINKEFQEFKDKVIFLVKIQWLNHSIEEANEI